MANPDELTPRQRRFVMAMLTGSVAEASALVGVTERAGYKWLRIPAVKRALDGALDGAMAEAVRRAVAAMTEALATLEAIHTDQGAPAGARVSAARAILESAPRLREALDLAARVAALEEANHERT